MKELDAIVIRSSYIFYGPGSAYFYIDKLHISKTSISYDRRPYLDNKNYASWSYKTTNEEFSKKYTLLAAQIKRNLQPPYRHNTDCGNFTIELVYSDGTMVSFDYTGDFKENKMTSIGKAIVDMVPCGEVYSDLIQSNVTDGQYFQFLQKLSENSNK